MLVPVSFKHSTSALLAPLVIGMLLALCPTSAAAHEPDRVEQGAVQVEVVDAETGAPLRAARITLVELGRAGSSDADGRRVFEGLHAGPVTVRVTRLGYGTRNVEVDVPADGILTVTVELEPVALEVEGLVVTGTARERGAGEVYRPTSTLSGVELQRNLAASVPQTLQRIPGFSVEYNGPGAASPRIRGMGGDRVLMLEDGGRTGDLYQTAADHGVMAEPLSAERIEVVRGPAGLLYGSNALGGVVNIIRDDVPRTRPSGVTGTLSSQYESVSDGVAGAAVVTGPAGPFTLRLEGTARANDDARTPAGTLERTDMRALNGALGLSLVRDWGFVGSAVRHYDNVYGVPGEFQGELIPGGHPGGVDIEARRTTGRFRAEYRRPFLGFFDSGRLDASAVRYLHDELEGILNGQPIVGACFDQTSWNVDALGRHDHTGDRLRAEGTLGLSFQGRDLEAGCSSPGTRSGTEWAVAAYGFEEFTRGPVRLQAGLRFDYRKVTPGRTDSIRVRTDQARITKFVPSERSFSDASGSLAALWDFRPGWTAGASVARSFRSPAIEEMFSDGPHLADFSFDIGEPALDSEIGLGFDLFLRADRPDLSLELAAYLNRVDDYISYVPTGMTRREVRDGFEPWFIPVFEARGEDSDFMGVEGRVQWEFLPRLIADGTLNWTRATRRQDGDPLSFIPPLSGQAELRWEGRAFSASLGLDAAAAQNRVPRPIQVGDQMEEPQSPTSGHGTLNAGLGWRGDSGRFVHVVQLQGRNLLDREYRDHLSRMKEVAPQPGRNLSLTYRVHF
ncbi:MAG: TonB-dependent receptor [Gemmatimonadales bacterium]|nr:MAG: TonB-dependent receptor [Gemmatimonadales bacterium]